VRMHRGHLYLVVIMDWLSRYVLAWRLSNSLESSFCVEALGEALKGRKPEMFNTDQGCQFSSVGFTSQLLDLEVKVSMTGKGHVFDNIFVERLWRSVKYEEVYLHDYDNGQEARAGLGRYFEFYNTERPHQALRYQTPLDVYTHGLKRG
jgi:putative transposase